MYEWIISFYSCIRPTYHHISSFILHPDTHPYIHQTLASIPLNHLFIDSSTNIHFFRSSSCIHKFINSSIKSFIILHSMCRVHSIVKLTKHTFHSFLIQSALIHQFLNTNPFIHPFIRLTSISSSINLFTIHYYISLNE